MKVVFDFVGGVIGGFSISMMYGVVFNKRIFLILLEVGVYLKLLFCEFFLNIFI